MLLFGSREKGKVSGVFLSLSCFADLWCFSEFEEERVGQSSVPGEQLQLILPCT